MDEYRLYFVLFLIKLWVEGGWLAHFSELSVEFIGYGIALKRKVLFSAKVGMFEYSSRTLAV